MWDLPRRRVTIIVSIASDGAASTQLREACHEKGWEIADEFEQSPNEEGRVTGKVDVFLYGSIFLARRAALREFVRLVEQYSIDVRIRRAELTHPPARAPIYRVYDSPNPSRGIAARFLSCVGWYDIASVAVRDDETEECRVGRLREEFPNRECGMRRHVMWRTDPHGRGTGELRKIGISIKLSLLVCMTGIALALTPVWGSASIGKILLCLLVAAGFAILLVATVARDHGTAKTKWSAAVALLAMSVLVSYKGRDDAFIWWYFAVVLGVLGMRFLLAGASFGVVASWVIPLIASIILSGLPGVNGIYQDKYLQVIGIKEGVASVPVSEFEKIWPPVVAVAQGWLLVFLCFSILGYLRYLHASRTVLFWAGVFLLFFALGLGGIKALDNFTKAIERGKADVEIIADGEVPSSYMGIHPELVKVHQLSKVAPYEGCRPGDGEKFISFGSVGERISLVKPGSVQVCTVWLKDYGFTVVEE